MSHTFFTAGYVYTIFFRGIKPLLISGFFLIWSSQQVFADEFLIDCNSVPDFRGAYFLSSVTAKDNESAADYIFRAAQSLHAQVKSVGVLNPKEHNKNVQERLIFSLRDTINLGQFFESFEEMAHSQCFRKDIRKIEDEIGAIEALVPRSALVENSAQQDLTNFKKDLNLVKRGLSALKQCGKKENSSYYKKEYLKKHCEDSRPIFKNIVKKYDELISKLESLEKMTSWGGLQEFGALFDSNSTQGKELWEQLDRQATVAADAWMEQNKLTKVLGIERFFTSSVSENNAAQQSMWSLWKEAKATAQIAEAQASEAIDVDTALSRAQNATEKVETLLEQSENQFQKELLMSFDHSGAELLKGEVEQMQESVKEQRIKLEVLTKNIKKTLNAQAQNVGSIESP